MRVTRAERALLVVTLLAVLYRITRDEWPVGFEVEDTE